jgi:hypothetical protein
VIVWPVSSTREHSVTDFILESLSLTRGTFGRDLWDKFGDVNDATDNG